MEKSKIVIYVDAFGKEHDALVTALNGLNAGYVSLVYVDMAAPEADNVKKLFDVAHMSDASKAETNANLPAYQLNCWKEVGEAHSAPPADHPMFDHQFKQPEYDQQGALIAPLRPDYAAEVAAHQEGLEAAKPSEADLDADAAEKKAAEGTSGKSSKKPKPIAVGK